MTEIIRFCLAVQIRFLVVFARTYNWQQIYISSINTCFLPMCEIY